MKTNILSGAVAEKVEKILVDSAISTWAAWNQKEREEFLRSGVVSGLVWKYGAAAPEAWPVAASMAEAEALVTVTRAKAAAAMEAAETELREAQGHLLWHLAEDSPCPWGAELEVDEAAAILGAVRSFLAEEAEELKVKLAAEAEAAVAVATRQWEVVLGAEAAVAEAEEALEAVVEEFGEEGWWWRKQLEDRKAWEAMEGRAAQVMDKDAAAWVALLRRAG